MTLKEKWNSLSSASKKKALATAIVGGVVTIAVGLITYFFDDKAQAAKWDSIISLTATFVLTLCDLLIKE